MKKQNRSRIVDYIHSHERAEQNIRESFSMELLGRGHRSAAPLYMRLLGSNRLIRAERQISHFFACASARAYGVFLLTFGLLTLLVHFARYYVETEVVDVLLPLLLGALCCLFSVPLLLPEGTLADVTERDPLTSAILYDFFCLKRVYRLPDAPVLRKRITVPLAVLLAGVGALTSPLYVLGGILLVVLLRLSFSAPEMPFLLSLLTLPYLGVLPHATVVLCILVGLSLLSYVRKALLGNRIFHLEGYDFLLGAFAVVYLISGIFNGAVSSFGAALVRILLLGGTILAANLITNRRIADSATAALGLASVPVSVYGIYQYFFMDIADRYSDLAFATLIPSRVGSTFDNPNLFAMFLCVAALFALYHTQGAKRTSHKILCGTIFALHIFAMVLTFSRGAWIALALSILLVLVLQYMRMPGAMLNLLLLMIGGFLFLPENVMARLFSIANLADSSIAYRLSILRSSVAMLRENLLLGVGVGEEAFRTAFTAFAEDSVTAPHSHNLFLQIGCEAGAVALLLFLLLLLWRARHITSYRRYTKVSSVRRASLFCTGVIFSLLLFGMTDSIFYHYSLYYLFFAVFGIGSAVLRIAKREHTDRLGYLTDEQSPKESAMEITIEKG